MKRRLLSLTIACALAATHGARAAEPEPADDAELQSLLEVIAQETEVATRNRQNADFVPGIVTVLGADEARALGARSVLDAIALVPGIEVSRDTRGSATLRVRGLDGARYTLKINGTTVGSYSRDELANGLNLAGHPTPMARQAAAVHALTIKRADLHQTRWRQIQVPLQPEHPARVATILDNLDALDDELAARQRAVAQPSDCYYELVVE